ncbi:PAS domain-containing sensor histidine kinase [Caldimonas tepidiphila]|uniref:PAS domain-containing sensor histidine kinase n=1 Tax=Caldimonas tepidiphila TaxID=2315841 RepID=UPI001472BDEF|nr:HAMP domain-containing sensor histidine kinase [Caldimonas tepidiphila]
MSEPDPTEEALLRLMIRQTRDHAVILLTPEGRVRSWLGAAPTLFGYRADEIIGQTLDCLFTEADRALGLPALELQVALQDGCSEGEHWHLRRDGAAIWTSGSTTALRDEQGQLLGFAKLMRDRTDHRTRIAALENRLKSLADENAGRPVFLAGVAHELRNLLTPLFNASYLLRLNPAAETLGQPLVTIERQLPALRRLADELGSAGRRLDDRPVPSLEEVDLVAALHGLAGSVQAEFGARDLTLHLLAPVGPVRIRMDGARFRQGMLHLLDNAARCTPGGGQVCLKASVEGPDAVVRVRHKGAGIAAEQLARLFELFTGAPDPAGKAPEDSELGMALLKELAELHGGTVEVRSEGIGHGSEFALRLPLNCPQQPVTVEPAAG